MKHMQHPKISIANIIDSYCNMMIWCSLATVFAPFATSKSYLPWPLPGDPPVTSVPHPWQGSGARRGKVRGSGGPVPTACAPPTARQLELRTMAQSLPAPAGLAAGLELAAAHKGLTAGPGLARWPCAPPPAEFPRPSLHAAAGLVCRLPPAWSKKHGRKWNGGDAVWIRTVGRR